MQLYRGCLPYMFCCLVWQSLQRNCWILSKFQGFLLCIRAQNHIKSLLQGIAYSPGIAPSLLWGCSFFVSRVYLLKAGGAVKGVAYTRQGGQPASASVASSRAQPATQNEGGSALRHPNLA